MGELLATIALILFSCNIVMTKFASARMPIGQGFVLAVGMNVVFGLVLFAGQVALSGWPAWRWNGLALFAVSGIFSVSLGRFFFFESVVKFGPARASVFQVSVPIFTVLIAWAALGERLRPLSLAGIAVAVVGLFLVVYVRGASSPGAPVATGGGREPGGRPSPLRLALSSIAVMGPGAALCYAIGNVLRGGAMARWDQPLLGAIVAAAAAFMLHLCLGSEGRRSLAALRTADRLGVRLFMLNGIVTICAQVLVIAAMRYTAVSVVALISTCVPVLVMPLSWLLFRDKERITARMIVGTALTLAGIALVLLG